MGLPKIGRPKKARKLKGSGPTTIAFYRNVPTALFNQFRAKCALLGTTQQDKFIDLIRRWVKGEIP